MRLKFVLLLFIWPFAGFAANIHIIPQPLSVTEGKGWFLFDGLTGVAVSNPSLAPQASFLRSQMQSANKVQLAAGTGLRSIKLQLTNTGQPAGAYQLVINSRGVTVSAANAEGIFYGIQSLLQLVNKNGKGSNGSIKVTALTVNDAPRYQWRGFMLDESRHFFGKEKVKMLLNWMARYKMNRFHWHLTDSHGWRLPISAYPKLTTVGGVGNFTDSTAAAKYYTKADIAEIVNYAKSLFITIIPEVDMPGHATAANRAYPEYSGGKAAEYSDFTFDPSNEGTYKYLTTIIKETSAMFPASMIHLGGDEVELGIKAWLNKPAITALMAKKNYTTPTQLEHYFFRRMADSASKAGNKILCWDEALDAGLSAHNTIIFWWRQNKPAYLKRALEDHKVVLCARQPLYFDYLQDSANKGGRRWDSSRVEGYNLQSVTNSYIHVYNFPDPYLDAEILQSKNILGVQANLWTEAIGSNKRLDYMLFPRMAALAEAGWTAQQNKNTDRFKQKMVAELRVYKANGIYYYNPFKPQLSPEPVDFPDLDIK